MRCLPWLELFQEPSKSGPREAIPEKSPHAVGKCNQLHEYEKGANKHV